MCHVCITCPPTQAGLVTVRDALTSMGNIGVAWVDVVAALCGPSPSTALPSPADSWAAGLPAPTHRTCVPAGGRGSGSGPRAVPRDTGGVPGTADRSVGVREVVWHRNTLCVLLTDGQLQLWDPTTLGLRTTVQVLLPPASNGTADGSAGVAAALMDLAGAGGGATADPMTAPVPSDEFAPATGAATHNPAAARLRQAQRACTGILRRFPAMRLLQRACAEATSTASAAAAGGLLCVNASAVDGTLCFVDTDGAAVAARLPLGVPLGALRDLHAAAPWKPSAGRDVLSGLRAAFEPNTSGDDGSVDGEDAEQQAERAAMRDAVDGVPTIADFVPISDRNVVVASFLHWRPLALISTMDGSVVAWLAGAPRVACSLAYVPQLQHVVAAGSGKGGMMVWDLRGGLYFAQQLAVQTTPPFEADTKCLVAGHEVDDPNAPTREVPTPLTVQPWTVVSALRHPVSSIVFCPASRLVATACRDSKLRLWDPFATPHRLTHPAGAIGTVARPALHSIAGREFTATRPYALSGTIPMRRGKGVRGTATVTSLEVSPMGSAVPPCNVSVHQVRPLCAPMCCYHVCDPRGCVCACVCCGVASLGWMQRWAWTQPPVVQLWWTASVSCGRGMSRSSRPATVVSCTWRHLPTHPAHHTRRLTGACLLCLSMPASADCFCTATSSTTAHRSCFRWRRSTHDW